MQTVRVAAKDMVNPGEMIRVELSYDQSEINVIPYVEDADGKRSTDKLGWYANYGWAQSIVGKQRIQNYWVCPINDALVTALEEWPADQIEWQGENVKAVLAERKATLAVRTSIADIIANYKKYGIIPEAVAAIKSKPGITLKPFQKLGAYIIKRTNGWGIWFEQGCGKTPTMIAGICELAGDRKNKEEPLRVLAVVPPNLIMNWRREIPRFSTRKCIVCDLVGPVNKRVIDMLEAYAVAKRSKSDYVIYLISSDSVAGFVSPLNYIKWDVIFVDESHGIKDPKARRSKAVLEELGYANDAAKKFTLTGTPLNNNIGDLYNQVEFHQRGRSGFSSHTQFRESFNINVPRKGRGIVLDGATSNVDKRLQEILAYTSFIVKKKDVLKDLPEKTFSVRGIEMSPPQMKAYKKLRDELVLEAAAELGSAGGSLTVNHILTKLLRLTQITAGFISWDPEMDEDGNPLGGRTIEHFPTNPKLDELLNIVNDLDENAKAIIWCTLQPSYDPIINAVREAGYGIVEYTGRISSRDARQRAEDDFNRDPNTRFLLGNPRSAGTGLNLLGYDKDNPSTSLTNCTTHINYSINWSWAQRAQAMDRSHRQGTREPLEIIDLICESSIDELILEAVEAKAAMADEISSIDIRKVLDSLKKGY